MWIASLNLLTLRSSDNIYKHSWITSCLFCFSIVFFLFFLSGIHNSNLHISRIADLMGASMHKIMITISLVWKLLFSSALNFVYIHSYFMKNIYSKVCWQYSNLQSAYEFLHDQATISTWNPWFWFDKEALEHLFLSTKMSLYFKNPLAGN